MVQQGLGTRNEGMNKRNMKILSNVADKTKYALAVPYNLGLGVDFWLCSEGDFLPGRP